jgi:SepF-like predicted cell division protein (DUF552 family)
MGFFDFLKAKKEDKDIESEVEEGYVELDTDSPSEIRSKIIVRPFVLKDFESIKPVLDALRSGKTIALVNIRPLKDKDLIELKRAISKLKKTTEAIDGEIAGFGEDYIVIAPSFAQIYRTRETTEVKEDLQKDDSGSEME